MAYAVGVATGDDALANVAADGLRDAQGSMGTAAAAVVMPGVSSGMLRAAEKGIEVASKTQKVEKTASGARVGDFTRTQKNAAKSENAAANGGQMSCTDCGKPLKNVKNEKGVPTPSDQAQVHHDPALNKGGGRDSKPVVVCPKCHGDRHGCGPC